MSSEARELAELFSANAAKLYKDDGEVRPVIAFRGGEREVIAFVELENNAPRVVASTIGVFNPLVKARYIVFVSETWSRSFPEPPSNIRRGELAEMHEAGDPKVHTSLLTAAWDLETLTDSLTILLDADDDMRREEIAGMGIGEIAAAVTAVAGIMPDLIRTCPDDYTYTDAIALLKSTVSAVLVEWSDKDGAPPAGAEMFEP